jgi:hypothetical protein
MGAVRVLETVLVAERVVVAAGSGKRGTAGANRVDMDPVQTRGQPGDVHVDMDGARAILDETHPADRLAVGVDECSAGMARSAGGSTGRQHGEEGEAGRGCDDRSTR